MELCYALHQLFYFGQIKQKKKKDVSIKNAVILGLIQAIAILPGISRSGSTIAAAVLLGIEREKAARFSFLMVLPLIFGSMAKKLIDSRQLSHDIDLLPLITGFIFAFITGLFACKWMIIIVKNSKLKYFSFYCLLVGGIALIYGLF